MPRTAQDAGYSPDGTRLAWSLGDGVYVADASGGGARRVAGGDGLSREGVAWSPDGTRLAYAVHCHDGCAVAVLDLGSGAEHELVADGDQPTWAPTGDKLAFRPSTPTRTRRGARRARASARRRTTSGPSAPTAAPRGR